VVKFKKLLWALRKTRLPVKDSAIVLDVGSGNNPHPRSDILLDRLSGSEHRGGAPMLIDRLAIIGDAVKMPFKDKSIDFIVASHILEHIPNPESFLSEIQRVGKAGYIETPNFLCERLIPCKAHCLEIAVIDDTLHIFKKSSYRHDEFIAELDFLNKNKEWKNVYESDLSLFHSRYYWSGEIKYLIHNPSCDNNWIEDVYSNSSATKEVVDNINISTGWRKAGLLVYQFIQRIKRRARMKKFDINSILACPQCKGELTSSDKLLHCLACNISFSNSPHINFENKLPN
jgi:SAM-dependent methyltransferase